tara:strand:+ start:9783 stop:10331 length:549 start_codon:yes stop_codon:yes gene_type:complete
MRRRTVKQRVDDLTFDLNLAPMLDMMVALVPFLLLSFVFIKLVVIESPIPQPVAEAIEKDRKERDKSVQLKVYVDNQRNVRIDEYINGKKKSYQVSSKNNKISLEEAHKNFVQLKLKHQKLFGFQIYPSDEVSYEEIIKLMDEARVAKQDGPNFEVVNKETKEKVTTKFMFPNITFGNIMEG